MSSDHEVTGLALTQHVLASRPCVFPPVAVASGSGGRQAPQSTSECCAHRLWYQCSARFTSVQLRRSH